MSVPSVPEQWDLEVDVIVVGGGNAGLPAAITAHDEGAQTLIVEANDFLGGLMRGSGGSMFFCDTHVQRRLGIEDHVEWGIEDEMRMSEFRAVPEIVAAYVSAGAETCEWLEALGLTWAQEVQDGSFGTGINGDRFVPRTHFAAVSPTGYYPGGVPEGQNGHALTIVLEKAVLARDIPVLFRHRMRHIFREPNGRVVGIQALGENGTVAVRARRGVVLACGGATTNEALVKAWDPRLVNDATYSDAVPYMTAMGDGLIAAQAIGAGMSDMSFVSFLPIKYGTHWYSLSLSAIAGDASIGTATGVPVLARRGGYQRIILVRGEGCRYIDESLAARENPNLVRDVAGLPAAEYPEEPFMRTFLSLPNPKNVWAIVDAESAATMKWRTDEMVAPKPMSGRGLHPDSVAVADTIGELARLIGMDPQTLAKTVERYNADAAAGADSEFGKQQPLYPLLTAPFYAAKLNVIRHTPAGGLRTNTRGQVLDHAALWDGAVATGIDEEPVIEGLYAAGEVAAFVGFRRAHRKTGPILTMGRLVGRAAGRRLIESESSR